MPEISPASHLFNHKGHKGGTKAAKLKPGAQSSDLHGLNNFDLFLLTKIMGRKHFLRKGEKTMLMTEITMEIKPKRMIDSERL